MTTPAVGRCRKDSGNYARERVSFELDGLVPFDGDGHWLSCLDYRFYSRGSRGLLAKEVVQTGPRVTYIDIESDSESIVASSFATLLR